jgi:hypothetical protein
VNTEVDKWNNPASIIRQQLATMDSITEARAKLESGRYNSEDYNKIAHQKLDEIVQLENDMTKIKSQILSNKDIVQVSENISSLTSQLGSALAANPDLLQALARAATLPAGMVVPFGTPDGKCPDGWRTFGEAVGRVIIGAGGPSRPGASSYPVRTTGGAESVTLGPKNVPVTSIKLPVFFSPEFSLENRGYGGDRFVGQKAIEAAKGATGTLRYEEIKGSGANEPLEPRPEPLDLRPPYVALTFCIKD